MRVKYITIATVAILSQSPCVTHAEGGGGGGTTANPNDFLPTAVAPEKVSITDSLGVSVTNGAFLHDLPSVSMGGGVPHGLELHFRDASGTPPTFNLHPKNPDYVPATSMSRNHSQFGQITQHSFDQYTWCCGVSVVFNNSSEEFGISSTPVAASIPSGSTLYYDSNNRKFTYTLKDGTKVYFSEVINGVDLFPSSGRYGGVLTKVESPDGVFREYAYQMADCFFGANACIRLEAINSNNGEQIKFKYQFDGSDLTSYGNSIKWKNIVRTTIINRSVEYCAETSTTCNFANDWPYLEVTPVYSPTLGVNLDAAIGYRILNSPFQVKNSAGEIEEVSLFVTSGNSVTQNPNRVYYPSDYRDDVNIQYYDDPDYLSANGPYYLKVKSVERGGQTWNYSYSKTSSGGILTATDPAGKSTVYESTYNAGPTSSDVRPTLLLTRVTDPLGRTTQYAYDTSTRRLTEVHNPLGDGERYAYDSRGNLTTKTRLPKTGSGLLEQSITSSFPVSCTYAATCNKPTWIRDYKGNQTDYTYSNTHGGILSEMAPAPSTGAARPLKLTTYVQRHAWVKNASGSLVQLPDPIWLVSTTTKCQTAAGSSNPICDNSQPKTVTTYEYGANGTRESLLVKGVAVSSGSTTLRTCFGYDIYNRKISETKPSASLSVCP